MQIDIKKNKLYAMSGCTPTEEAVLKLTEAAFSGKRLNKDELSDTDWRSVYSELKAQAAAAVPVDALAEMEYIIPQDLFNEWLAYSVQVMGFGENVLYYQSELTELFESNNIPLAILKGASASCCYPNPMYRNMGDIDFLVDKENFQKALDLMLENGYRLAYPIDHVDYHITLAKGNMMYELHKEPAGIADGEKGNKIRALFDGQCANAEQADINGYRFYRLPSLQNGIVLLLHIVKHLDEGLGLRQICDWMAFVNSELSDKVWQNEFQPVLKEAGLESLACITTRMCKLYLGLSDSITWCDNADTQACAEFMRFVLDNGNFGHKSNNTRRTTAVLGHNKDENGKPFVIGMLYNLQRNGAAQWKAVQRFPALKCIAWAYIPVRYIGKLLTGKRTLSQTKQLAESIGKNKSLQDKLAVYK